MGKSSTDTGWTPAEIALKSFFLGPQAENAVWVKSLVERIVTNWIEWRRSLYVDDGSAITPEEQNQPEFIARLDQLRSLVEQLLRRFEGEIPSFNPRYIGHMMSEVSVPAFLGHLITLIHNPNNVVHEASLVGTELEREAINDLARMMGFDPVLVRGHFTSGGTVANIEGLVRARARMSRWISAAAYLKSKGQKTGTLFEGAHGGWENYDRLTKQDKTPELRKLDLLHNNPFDVAQELQRLFGAPYRGPVVLVPESKHYSWPKAVMLMGIGSESFWPVDIDAEGRVSIADLKRKIDQAETEARPVLAVVSVAGTTELGEIDRVHEVQTLLDTYKRERGINIWHHVDAAYGGFFCALPRRKDSPVSPEVFAALDAIHRAESVTIDPHKLGYVPYASGAFLVRETREYYVTPFDAPYLRWAQNDQKGTQTLEGSRSAGGAVATWLCARAVGFDADGYGLILERTIQQRVRLEGLLRAIGPDIRIYPGADTNVLCFCVARKGEASSKSSARADRLYREFAPGAGGPFVVSKTELRWSSYEDLLNSYIAAWEGVRDSESLTMIRLTLMNPFFDSKENKIDYGQEFVRALTEKLDL